MQKEVKQTENRCVSNMCKPIRVLLYVILTIVINPRVVGFLNINPPVWSAFARHDDGRVSISVMLELGEKMKSNHGGFTFVAKRAFNT